MRAQIGLTAIFTGRIEAKSLINCRWGINNKQRRLFVGDYSVLHLLAFDLEVISFFCLLLRECMHWNYFLGSSGSILKSASSISIRYRFTHYFAFLGCKLLVYFG